MEIPKPPQMGLSDFGGSTLKLMQPVRAAPPLPKNSLLEDDFIDPYQNFRANPTPQTRGALLKQLDPIISTALTSYGLGQGQSPTLRSRARILALQGLDRYDPAQARMKTFMMQHLQGLRRFAAQEGEVITVPERIKLDLFRTSTASKELQDQLGREPTLDELADFTGLSKKRLLHIQRSATPTVTEGMVLSANEQNENADLSPAVNQLDNDPWLDFVYQDLGPNDKLIMDYAMGRNGKRQLGTAAIAQKLHVTPGAITQRLAKIQQMLDERESADVGL